MGTHRVNKVHHISRYTVDDGPDLLSSSIEHIFYCVHGLINSIPHGVDSIVHSISDPIDDVTKRLGRALGGYRSKVTNNSSGLCASVCMAEGLQGPLHCSGADGIALNRGVGRSNSQVYLSLPIGSSSAGFVLRY